MSRPSGRKVDAWLGRSSLFLFVASALWTFIFWSAAVAAGNLGGFLGYWQLLVYGSSGLASVGALLGLAAILRRRSRSVLAATGLALNATLLAVIGLVMLSV